MELEARRLPANRDYWRVFLRGARLVFYLQTFIFADLNADLNFIFPLIFLYFFMSQERHHVRML
jgi:hypothetical protein